MHTTKSPHRGLKATAKDPHTSTSWCGLEVPEEVAWQRWQTGGEYTRAIAVKNVTTKVIIVEYQISPTKVFSMGFPEPIRIYPGMTHNLQVVFRPLEAQEYQDYVTLFVEGQQLVIPLRATLPTSRLQVPDSLAFGCVPAKETAEHELVISNTGDTLLSFTWKVEPPYRVEPPSGQLQAGAQLACKVFFTPMEAATFTAYAACTCSYGEQLLVQITGSGKFPYLSLEQTSVDLGEVLVGSNAVAEVRFGNHSQVPAHFRLVPDADCILSPAVFDVTPAQGTLCPNEYSILRICYTPRHTGTFSCQHFTLSTPGGNQLQLTLQGVAVGPMLRLSTRLLDFGNVAAGQHPTKVVYLENASATPLTWQFQAEEGEVWGLSKLRGVIAPWGTCHVTVTFRGDVARPANYWRRLVCLVKDAEPVGIDLLATAYTSTSRPPPLLHQHIKSYLERVAQGGDPIPSALQSSMGDGLHSTGGSGEQQTLEVVRGDTRGDSGGSGGSPEPGTGHEDAWVGPDSWQLLFHSQDPAGVLQVSSSEVDFGACSCRAAAGQQSFVVTNHSSAKLVAFVVVPGAGPPGKAAAAAGTTSTFQVFPESAELAAYGSATFRVAFRPAADGRYYCQQLMVCAHVKAMRNFRLVTPGQVVPPWCVPVTAVGNTFAAVAPDLSPKVSASTRSITFPACRLGEAAAQTLQLKNYGTTPAAFTLSCSGGESGPVLVMPSRGVLPPDSTTVVSVLFRPQVLGPWSGRLTAVYNNSAATTTTIALHGSAQEPELRLGLRGKGSSSGGHRLVFRPTCVGAQSRQELVVVNPCDVPVGWAWRVSRLLQGVISVEPQWGILRGRERLVTSWTFTPTQQQKHQARACLMVLPPESVADVASHLIAAAADGGAGGGELGSPGATGTTTLNPALDQYQQLVVELLAPSTGSTLSWELSEFDLGEVKVGHPVTRSMHLINQSEGVLYYSCQVVRDEGSSLEAGAAAVVFDKETTAALQGEDAWLDEPEGAVPARATKALQLTVLPRWRGTYQLSLHVRGRSLQQVKHSSSGGGGMRGMSASSGGSMGSPLGHGGPGSFRAGSPAGLEPLGELRRRSEGSLLGAGTSNSSPRTAQFVLPASPQPQTPPAPPLATASIKALAVMPSVLVTGVECEGLPRQLVWQMLGVPALNAELAAPLTDQELHLMELDEAGQLTTDKACALSRAFDMDLGPLALGAAPRRVWVTLSNQGALPAAWELHSYDDPEVELENWVETSRPLTQAEKLRNFVLEAGLFKALPRSGTLQPGQCTQVCLTLTPAALGSYALPLFLRIHDSKQLQLQLHGTIVDPLHQVGITPPGGHVLQLEPAPLGELDPPLQGYTLVNPGHVPLRYSLDLEPLAHLVEDSWGFPVVRYVGGAPPSGTIPPFSTATLLWQFQPLEARAYSLALPLRFGRSAQQLLVVGRGYHPVAAPQEAAPTQQELARCWRSWRGFSSWSRVSPPGAALALSHQVLELGSLAVRGRAAAITALTNTSCGDMAFSWDMAGWEEAGGLLAGRLVVVPATGVLSPGEAVLCQVSLTAGVQPQLVEAVVRCHARPADPAVDELPDAGTHLSGSPRPGGSTTPRGSKGASRRRPGSPRPPSPLGMSSRGVGDTARQQDVAEEEEEEVIAEHPARSSSPVQRVLRRALRERLPLHLSMTEATCARFGNLKERYSTTLGTLRASSGAPLVGMSTAATLAATATAGGPAAMGGAEALDGAPQVQVLTVTLTGRILSAAQIRAGTYVPAGQQEPALLSLAGAAEAAADLEQAPAALDVPDMGPLALISKVLDAAAAAAAAGSGSHDEDEDASPVAGGAAAEEAAAVATTGDLLEQLVQDVWREPAVVKALQGVQQAPVLPMLQLRQQAAMQEQQQQQGGESTLRSARKSGRVVFVDQPQSRQAEAGASLNGFVEFVVDSALMGLMQEGVVEQGCKS